MADQQPSLADRLYASALQSYGIKNDTLPVDNPQLRKDWVALIENFSKYAQSGNSMWLKRGLEEMKLQEADVESIRKTVASLVESQGRNERVSAQNAKDIINNLMNNRTRLAAAGAATQGRVWNAARAKYDSVTGTSQDKISAASEEMFNTLAAEGSRINVNNPSIKGIASDYAREFFNKDLHDLTPEEARDVIAKTGNSPLAVRVYDFIRKAKQSLAEWEEAGVSLDNAKTALNMVGADGRLTAEGQNTLLGNLQSAQARLENLFGVDPRLIQERLKDIQANDEVYQRLLGAEQFLRGQLESPGQEDLRTRMGRSIADPAFRAWAADNGFDKLGQAEITADGKVVYVPGPDDERATVRFAYQATHPDRYGRLFHDTADTGEIVTVTATDPAERDRVLRERDLGNGTYAVNAEGGKAVVYSPDEYKSYRESRGWAPTGIQSAVVGNDLYVKDGLNKVYKVNADGTKTEVDTAPAGAAFKPAVIYPDGTGHAERYATLSDLDDATLLASGRIGFEEPDDKASIANTEKSTSPIQVVGADQIPALGQVQVTGYRKRLNANEMAQYGTGAFSVIDPVTGKTTTFRSGVTFEVHKKKPEETHADLVDAQRQTWLEGKGITPMTPDQLIGVKAKTPPAPPETPVIPGPLALTAAASRDADARMQMLAGGGKPLVTPAEAAAAGEAIEQTRAEVARRGAAAPPTAPAAKAPVPAPATPGAAGAPAVSAAPTGAAPAPTKPSAPAATAAAPPAAPTAPTPATTAAAGAAPAAAPAAPAEVPGASYKRDRFGAVYEITDAGARQIQPEPGKALDTRVIPADSSEFGALKERLDKGGKDLTSLEGRLIKTLGAGQMPGSETLPKPEPKVSDFLGSTRIESEYAPPAPKKTVLESVIERRAARKAEEAAAKEGPPGSLPPSKEAKKTSEEAKKAAEDATKTTPPVAPPEAGEPGTTKRPVGDFTAARSQGLESERVLGDLSRYQIPVDEDLTKKYKQAQSFKDEAPQAYYSAVNQLADEAKRRAATREQEGIPAELERRRKVRQEKEQQQTAIETSFQKPELIPGGAPKFPTFNQFRTSAFGGK